MSIALSIKINDGLVLAADSASTLLGQDPRGGVGIVNTYNNANKVFNLVKGLPIGIVTWGAGSIGLASIATLIKDLRKKLSAQPGSGQTGNSWAIDSENYTIEGVANTVRKFIYEDNYLPAFKDWPQKPDIAFIVGGYSFGAPMADEYSIHIVKGECGSPQLLRQKPGDGNDLGRNQRSTKSTALGVWYGLASGLANQLTNSTAASAAGHASYPKRPVHSPSNARHAASRCH